MPGTKKNAQFIHISTVEEASIIITIQNWYIYIRDLGPSQIILITNLTPSNEKTVKGLKTEQLRNCCIPLKNVPQSNPLPVLNTENETGSF